VENPAPGIKELKAQINDLEKKRLDLAGNIRDVKVRLLKASAVKKYVDDLRALLSKGSSAEQKILPSLLRQAHQDKPLSDCNKLYHFP